MLGDRAGHGADRCAAGQDVSDRAVQPAGDPLRSRPAPITWSPTLTFPEALAVRSISMTLPEDGAAVAVRQA